MLSRPFLINHTDCTIVMPTLALERNPERPDQPLPFRHMNLYCQLCLDMVAQLGRLSGSGIDKAEVARKLQDVVEKWFENLPAEYAVQAPDTRWDGEYDWVLFQRRYLHLKGYMSLFSQLRPSVTQSSAKPMTSLESALRAAGVQAALGLMDVSWSLFENLFSVGAKFHYAVFCIFDSATVMCSALLHDEARNLPQRDAILESIKKGLCMLGELYAESKTAAALYRILRGLLAELPLSSEEQGVIGAPKRTKKERIASSRNEIQVAQSPSDCSPHCELPNANQVRGSNSASSNGDTTLNSSNVQPGSERSLSQANGGRSINAHAPLDEQARRSSVVPSQGVQPIDHPPPSNSFMASTGLHPSYPATTDSFVPTTSTMPSGVFVASEGFAPAHNFVQPTGFQYDSSALGPPDGLPYSQAGWQPAQVAVSDMNNMNMFQGGNLGLQNAAPTGLGFWDWQGLGVGHPVSWGESSMQVNESFDNRKTASDRPESTVADKSPKSR
jgi:hypothetical protein